MNIESLTEAYKSGRRDNQQRAIFMVYSFWAIACRHPSTKIDPVITVK